MAQVEPYLDKYYVHSRNTRLKYPSPFFDLSRDYMPKNIKTLFKWCRVFFYRNGFLHSVITKLTEYPITELLYEKDVSKEDRKRYDLILHHHINIKKLLIQIGLDYFTFGNSFVSVNTKFNRFLKCPRCGNEEQIKHVDYKWRNYQFHANCKNKDCNSTDVVMQIVDKYLKNPENIKFIRWAPESIDLEYDPLTGETTYYYKIPAVIKSNIVKGKKSTLERTPKLFIQSLKEHKKIELDKNNFYHFKRATLAEEDMGWGKPIILPALADIWYMQTLRRGNEAIAAEHIIPFRMVYPSSAGTMDPFSQMSLADWRSQMLNALDMWKRDPNYIGIFPVPAGQMNFGGDAKILMVTQELRFLEESIINGLGVPLEFIKGGASWTGSSISLRIIENHFLNYRHLLEDFINFFLVKKIHKLLDYGEVTLKFKRLRMADDSDAKRLAMELAATGKISTPKLLDDFGYDYEEEKANIKNSFKFESELEADRIAQEADSQGRAQEVLARYQVRAEAAAMEERARIREELFKAELESESDSPEDASLILAKMTEEITLLPPVKQKTILKAMQQDQPYTYSMLVKRIEEKELLETMQLASIFGTPSASQSESKPETKKTGNKKSTAAKKTSTQKNDDERQKAGHPRMGPK
jgi:hypothetical protein